MIAPALLAQAAAITAAPPNVWELGLAAGVISGLFYAMRVLFEKYATTTKSQAEEYSKSTKEQSDKFTESIKELNELHRQERLEWRQDAQKREDRVTKVCDDLIRTIHESA